jgi:hypothetical protein
MQIVDLAIDPGRHGVLAKGITLLEHLAGGTRCRFRRHFEDEGAEMSAMVTKLARASLLTHGGSIATYRNSLACTDLGQPRQLREDRRKASIPLS